GASCAGRGGERTLILHWNGTAWQQVASPVQKFDGYLAGVAATSASNAWAVGSPAVVGPPFILHWSWTGWQQVAIPIPGKGDILTGVAATSATNASAVGSSFPTNRPRALHTLILHWNGTAWQQVASPTPNPGDNNFLQDVAATSASDAWAVGYYFITTGVTHTLIEHWNGTAWRRVKSPDPSSTKNVLTGVAASSATNAWAVGSYKSGTVWRTLALHCWWPVNGD